MKRKIVLTSIAVVLFANYLLAQKPAIVTNDEPGWQKIGETTASFKKQNESIHVIGADEFSSIRLKILDAPLSIERLQVFYGSGEMEEINVKSEIEKDGETKSFQLKYPAKGISKVAFTYQSTPNSEGEKANVILYGMKGGDQESAYRANENRSDADEAREATEEAGEDVKRAAKRTANHVENAVEDAGDAVSETASKAAAEITDERHETKVGPNGETIYVAKSTDYYYVNDEGKKVYLSEGQLKEKKDN
jgi:predicted  nucleic acid-binding Zn-ribbon protein